MRVDVDEAGRDDASVGVDGARRRLVDRRRSRRCGRRGCRRRRGGGARRVPSTTSPPLITKSSMKSMLGERRDSGYGYIPHMKLGLGLDIWAGAGLQMPVEQVREAERLGFDSVWTAEAYGADAITPLAFLAAQTSRIRLGTAIVQISAAAPRRQPRWRWPPSTRSPAAGA